ncbi:ATP-binding protein [Nonomuraea sp. NPDC050536]|uniref:ATP-binding protein n=1 Tax=Nonomuraea sp. NPDC050536 TaxID=3364366 RepID=UPI0037C93304
MGDAVVGRPDPARAADLAEFIRLLDELRMWAGGPSFRALAKRVTPLLRPPRPVSHSTVAEVFRPRRRRLDIDLVVAIVRALGVDEECVGQWHGECLRVHREAKLGALPGMLRQLPSDLPAFVGRQREITQLLAIGAATSRPAGRSVSIAAIEGMAGVGKTQLAVHVAHQLVQRGHCVDVQLYVNLHGFDEDSAAADPSVVLDSFLRALDVPAAHIPPTLPDRVAMFRDRLQGRHAVIVLDNAADEHQVRPLLPASPTCLVLVTSRRTMAGLDGATVHQLEVLNDTEAVRLLAAVAGSERVDANPAAATEVAHACGNLPLALTIAAARLKARGAWTTGDLLDHLHQGGLDAVTVGRRSLRPVFDLSFTALTRRARRMFLLLAIQPGADVTEHAAAALAGTTPGAARKTLEGLCDEYLLLQRAPGRFELHNLLRAYAVETAADRLSVAERAAAMEGLLAWYTRTVEDAATTLLPSLGLPPMTHCVAQPLLVDFSDRVQAVAWLEAEHANLLAAAAKDAGDGLEAPWRIPAAASVLRAVSGRWLECETLLTDALSHVQRTGNLAAQAWIQNRLGATATELGRVAQAEELFTAALITRRLLQDRDGEAAVLNNLVIFYGRTGRPALGLEHATAALDLARRGVNTDREASALSAMASCLSQLGRNSEALELMQQVLAIREARGDGYRLALAYIHTGGFHRDLGQYVEAEACHVKAREIARHSGDRFGEGEALLGQAKALLGRGRAAEARDPLREAVGIFEELHADQYVTEARQLREEADRLADST